MRRATAGLVALVMLSLAAAPAGAQGPQGGASGSIELGRPASQALLHLQETWIQWMSALYQDDAEAGERQVADLLATAEQLGMQRLPELSIGASVRAMEAARQGNFERADWVLATAERLDPGRPETAFARAVRAWEAGGYLAAAGHQASGYWRLLGQPTYRLLAMRNLLLLTLSAALLAAGAFVLLLLATHGAELCASLFQTAGRLLPGPGATVAVTVLLVWPLVLPGGPAWLLLYWSVLLWRFSAVSQRVVLVAAWVLVGVSPLVVALQQRTILLGLSPPVQAMTNLAQGRLYGALFTDIGVLRTVLPEEPAVRQVLGDLHRRLGQWEQARTRYMQVLEEEPDNVAALLDVGGYYFRKGDYGNAVQYFRRAANADPESAPAYFNLSQAYSESYLFDEQKQALSRAQELDDGRVSRWIQQAAEERVVGLDGGLARRDEIARLLAAAWDPGGKDPSQMRAYGALALPLIALALALALSRLLRRPSGGAQATPISHQSGVLPRLVRVAVPGLTASEEGQGGRAFAALLLTSLLVMLLAADRIGYDLPLGVAPGTALPSAIATLGLVVFFTLRLVVDLRAE